MRIFIVTISSVFIILRLTNVINVDWINILFPLCIYITIIATNKFTLWAVGKTIEGAIEDKKNIFNVQSILSPSQVVFVNLVIFM